MSNLESRLHSVSLVSVVAVCVSVALSTNAVASDWQTDVSNIQLKDDLLNFGFSGHDILQVAQSDDGQPPSDDGAQAAPDDGGQAKPGAGAQGGGQQKAGEFANSSTKELSLKTADPTTDIAVIFTQFSMPVSDGDDLKDGDHKMSGVTVFQPFIPVPIFGEGLDEWRVIARPTIEFRTQEAIPEPQRNFSFSRKDGFSDLLLPLPVALPKSISGPWLVALGPDFSFPTATRKAFGVQQYTAGVTGILGYLGENGLVMAFPQFYWGFADQGRDDDVKVARFGNMFYGYWYNLEDDLQIGASPTITYNAQADSGNKWNVPVGLGFAKMLTVGETPIRLEGMIEYSVVREKDFGQEWLFKINVIPIVPRFIKSPLFGS